LKLIRFSLLPLLLLLAGCPASPTTEISSIDSAKPTSFDVVFKEFAGAAGITRIYHVTPETISIVAANDSGESPHEVWRKPLPKDLRDEFARYISQMPFAQMRRVYDSGALDGFQWTFTIIDGTGARHEFVVANMSQPDLEGLAHRILGTVEREQTK
jgi:hypothetical protein